MLIGGAVIPRGTKILAPDPTMGASKAAGSLEVGRKLDELALNGPHDELCFVVNP